MLSFIESVSKSIGFYDHKALAERIKDEIHELNYFLFEPKESEEKM